MSGECPFALPGWVHVAVPLPIQVRDPREIKHPEQPERAYIGIHASERALRSPEFQQAMQALALAAFNAQRGV